jgi:hypothetical protein
LRRVTVAAPYPRWKFYPTRLGAPDWARGVIDVFAQAQPHIDSRRHSGVTSDNALETLRPGLEADGFEVEHGKRHDQKLHRPVLFGEEGEIVVKYEVDAYHRDHRVVVEVEAGRGAANNADYRDLVRASLMVDADFLVLAMMLSYRSGEAGQEIRSYTRTRDRIDAIYASERLMLQLKGILLVGY